MAAHDVLAPIILLFVEEMGVPVFISGDAILAYTGYTASRSQDNSLWLAVSVATIAILLGSSILFFASRKWGEFIILKLGRFLFIKESHIKRAEKLFAKYGVWTIIIGRHIPGMRIPITIFAATSGVSYLTFILSVFVTTILWAFFYLQVGMRYGGDIQHIFSKSVGLSVAIIVGIVLLIVALHLIGRYRNKRQSN